MAVGPAETACPAEAGCPAEAARGDVDALVARARALVGSAAPGGARRRLLGLAGAPGAGKSTLATELVDALGCDTAVLVPMDGFHLADAELVRLGIRDRKGASDTFDAAGYVTLLRRLREHPEQVVYAPYFRRDIEDAIAGAIRVPASVPLVVTEGNYLLADGEWAPVRGLLDEVWYLEPHDEERLDRLTRRHLIYGCTPLEAAARARGVDQLNAMAIASTRSRADLVVRG